MIKAAVQVVKEGESDSNITATRTFLFEFYMQLRACVKGVA